jgi:pimeloyl-ACP methyl ester carboxylesterase
MKFLFVHGGPGMQDYLENFFKNDFFENGIFYSQNQNISTINDAINELCLQTNPLNDYVFIGHSWGGTLCLEYLKRKVSPKPKALVLISSPISYHCNEAFTNHMKKLGLETPTPFDIFLSQSEKIEIKCRSLLETILSTLNMETLGKIDKSYLQSFQLEKTLRDLDIPVLLISGNEDHRLPTDFQKKYSELKPNLKMYFIDQAGHFPFLLEKHKNQVVNQIYSFSNTTKNPTSS